jgi:hypothetical protein
MRCFSLCPLHANKRLGMQTEVHMLTKALLLGEHLKSRSSVRGPIPGIGLSLDPAGRKANRYGQFTLQ